ncbi:protein BREAST CANCER SUSCEPTIBILITY 1 homolog isoform X2 [Humulus lupulus]|uniref:protein BREAST CANCER SUSCEPTIBILITY 1 homolog isoform X2 n=1 Tax=Humulus lupulus TaxID=3486 RepID=UPI002B40C2C3|nr:protein BREAST CANCER SUSCEPTIBILITY 1 homolog isoform X2 [Humulus lupulus]
MMADPNHLERMGRELKCPICLSLLNAAATLNCNHVFCNSCIVKSMKSDSNCPVCKVPYRRREIRPVPHMDNLVSIYKSMEVASGMNIFITQNASASKSSGGKQLVDDCNIQNRHDSDQICIGKQDTFKEQGSIGKCNSDLKVFDSGHAKLSFPAKKRIQVPHSQPEGVDKLSEKSSKIIGKKPIVDEKGLNLSPFFWLRDEENLSQQTCTDSFINMSHPAVPAFSDIKDSDDEKSFKLTPERGESGKSYNVADMFDSEMFEWTQRACSPELCTSPFKTQVAETDDLVVQGEGLKEVPKGKKRGKVVPARTEDDICTNELNDSSLPGTNYASDQAGCQSSKKRGRKEKKAVGATCPQKNAKEVGISVDSNEKGQEMLNAYKMQVADELVVQAEDLKVLQGKTRGKKVLARKQDNGCTNEFCDTSLPGTTNANDQAGCQSSKKRGRKVKKEVGATCPEKNAKEALGISDDSNEKGQERLNTFKRAKKILAASDGAETLDEGNKDTRTELPISLGKKKRCKDLTSKKPGSNCDKIHVQNQIQHPVRLKKQRLGSMQNDSEEASTVKNQTTEDAIANLSALLVPLANKIKPSESMNEPSKLSSKANSSDHGLRNKRKLKVSFIGDSTGEIADDIPKKLDVGSLTDPSKVKKLSLTDDKVLQRCQNIPSKIQCAFCLSSEESEASGEMVHYYNGRPVAADYNGGSKVIHSHRSCTEWAPNVYFEDDVAINLEAELTRSRRIKCSCCGTKGAALGCYEKCCRKSFHVTCAKLMPQCRWDMVNFVMLCPLHPDSNFHSESSESQARKRTCDPRKSSTAQHNKVKHDLGTSPRSSVQHNKIAVKHDLVTSPSWSSGGFSKKIVLCCSALTNSERETVSEFERISGITVSKKWESNVTHVIASADESGACRRTLKVLMGILDGKWILSMKWIKACMEAMKLVDEECFEINVDSHGIQDGPRLGRIRVQKKQPKLFDGFQFYFMGEFESSYKGYLQDLITAAGGTILHRKPVSAPHNETLSSSSESQTYVIYSLELPNHSDSTKRDEAINHRRYNAEVLASSSEAKVVSNSWVLNSIAASKLQSF